LLIISGKNPFTCFARQIRIEADGGDPDCEQIVLDLHRMAALFIVERMRSEIVATVRACGDERLKSLGNRRAPQVFRSNRLESMMGFRMSERLRQL